jgi:hypothetical protein
MPIYKQSSTVEHSCDATSAHAQRAKFMHGLHPEDDQMLTVGLKIHAEKCLGKRMPSQRHATYDIYSDRQVPVFSSRYLATKNDLLWRA